MLVVEFSALAEIEIEETFRESMKRHGQRRTDRYFHELDAELERLAGGDRLTAVPVTGVPGILRYRVAKHYLFFQTIPYGIFVSRFLHTSRLQSHQFFPPYESR